jgi:hypothetical protein
MCHQEFSLRKSFEIVRRDGIEFTTEHTEILMQNRWRWRPISGLFQVLLEFVKWIVE